MAAQVVGLDVLLADLTRMRDRARDARPALDAAADVALASVDRNFEEGGRPAWTPHAPSTLRRLMGPRRLLEARGDLRGSFEKKVGRREARVFPTDWKAAFHELGTKMNGRQHIPSRSFLRLQAEDVVRIGEIVFVHVTR